MSAGDGRARRDAEWARKKRLAEVFGEALPETTSDERDDAAAERSRTSDDWLRSQVPPHHGS